MKHPFKTDPWSTEELPANLREALRQFRETPQPDPAAWQATRAAFLAEAHQFAAESVTFQPVTRRKGWVGKTLQTLIPSFKEANPMLVLLKVALILSLATGAGAGAVTAAQNSLPGSPLYPVKTAWEDTQAHFAATPETRLEQALSMAQARVSEMQQLAEYGEEIPAQVTERYARHLDAAVQALGDLPEPLQTQARARLQEQLALHEQTLERVQERLQQRDGDETPVQEMEGILKRTRDRLQDPQGEPPATPPEPSRTPNPQAPTPGAPTPPEHTPSPADPGAGPGEPGMGPGGPGAGPGELAPTEPAPGPGEPGAGPGEPGAGPGEPAPTEPAPGPGEPGAGPGGPGPNPASTATPRARHP
ncbi:MAG: hypothetical protein GYA30_12075 [Chloroflexi bacterium]|nr:hypothetical protein [Chloroflexota bacterium]